MPGVARKDKKDTVHSPHGIGPNCSVENIYHTDQGSDNVFVNNIGVVREGDKMEQHPNVGCDAHSPTLTKYSSNVYANNKKLGRKDDEYDGHVITSASTTVFANS